ncbi:MAG: bifunctional diguanylate cyclase/phosphodiesterase [Actinomycetes bacterium]
MNEALTHAAGDRVLTAVAARIATVADTPDQIARGTGDEFVIIIPDLVRAADAGMVAEQVRQAAKGTLFIRDQELQPTVSIGIATGGRGASGSELVRDASLAMRQAKADGRDRWEFSDNRLAVEARRRLTIEAGIRDGLNEGQFAPWFQPIVDLSSRAVVGYEALMRWVQSDGTVVEPGGFLPIAERTHLVADLDLVALWRSTELLARLPASQHVAVNVSVTTLNGLACADNVKAALTACGVEPSRLHLEVTETALLTVNDHVRAVMHELAGAGVRWYVDDFGTGYSTIAHLRDLPFAGLKLDGSFTAGVGAGDLTCERLTKGLIGLADGLGLDTVAERIETSSEAAIMRAQGWRHGQGWLYGHPVPGAALTTE